MTSARYKWLVVALLWVVALLNYLDRQVIFAVFPLLKTELNVSSLELGLLGTSFLWIYGLLSPLGGYAADRFRLRLLPEFFSAGGWRIAGCGQQVRNSYFLFAWCCLGSGAGSSTAT